MLSAMLHSSIFHLCNRKLFILVLLFNKTKQSKSFYTLVQVDTKNRLHCWLNAFIFLENEQRKKRSMCLVWSSNVFFFCLNLSSSIAFSGFQHFVHHKENNKEKKKKKEKTRNTKMVVAFFCYYVYEILCFLLLFFLVSIWFHYCKIEFVIFIFFPCSRCGHHHM